MFSCSLLMMVLGTLSAGWISFSATEEIVRLFAALVTCAGVIVSLVWAPLILKLLILMSLLWTSRYVTASLRR